MSEFVVVLVTVASEQEGEKIAREVVEGRLAACVNIVGPVRSLYRWEGKVADEREYLLLIKTRAGLFPRLEARVREVHSYEVPEVVALPVTAGSEAYLRWLAQSSAEP